MPISRLLIVSLLALSLGGLLSACQDSEETGVARTEEGVLRPGSVVVTDTATRAVAPSERPLVLEGLRGSVHLTGTDQSTADPSFVLRGRGDTREAGQSVLEGISITESGTDAEYTYALSAEQEDRAAVDIRGQVPRQATLRIDRLSGPVRIDSVEGALTIDNQHGNVHVQGAAAPVEVTITNGNVQVDFQSVPAEEPILLETSNGDIRLGLATGASAQIDAQTDVGTIRTQGLSFTNEQFALVNAGARYEAQLGEGGPTIELRTQNGSITIRAVSRARTDTTEAGQRPAPTVPSSDTTLPSRTVPDTQGTDTQGTDTQGEDTVATDTSITVQDTVSTNR